MHMETIGKSQNGGWSEERNKVREIYDVTIGVISAGM